MASWRCFCRLRLGGGACAGHAARRRAAERHTCHFPPAQAASPAIAGFADPLGNSPLTIAIESGNLDAVSALLGKSPPPTLAGAILVAAAFNRHQLIPVLVRHGADVRETDVSAREAPSASVPKLAVAVPPRRLRAPAPCTAPPTMTTWRW